MNASIALFHFNLLSLARSLRSRQNKHIETYTQKHRIIYFLTEMSSWCLVASSYVQICCWPKTISQINFICFRLLSTDLRWHHLKWCALRSNARKHYSQRERAKKDRVRVRVRAWVWTFSHFYNPSTSTFSIIRYTYIYMHRHNDDLTSSENFN